MIDMMWQRISDVLASVLRNAADKIAEPEEVAADPDILDDKILEYLENLASESFKRQVDLDESVWRSLPFVAATFAFVAAVIGQAAKDVPVFQPRLYEILLRTLLIVAVISLGWTLRWFFVVLRPREYEYPATDEGVKLYAEQMTAFHSQMGLSGDQLSARVVLELRTFMIAQYGSAAKTNLSLNAVRLQARSKVLLFILVGFVLAFSCEAIMFVHADYLQPRKARDDQQAIRGVSSQGHADDRGKRIGRGDQLSRGAQRPSRPCPPHAAEVTTCNRGR